MKLFGKNRHSLRANRDKSSLQSNRNKRPLRMRRAETLIEVIMSIFIIATGSAAATSLIVTALQSNSFSRDNLIALNLAVEGIEAMRNIRDSNWLKFGFDKENCWNTKPSLDACDGTPGTLITEASYAIDLNPSLMKWTLTSIVIPLDLGDGAAGNDSSYLLKYVDLTPPGTDRDLYVSSTAVTSLVLTSSGDSIFYRMITVSGYVDSDGVAAAPEEAEEMTVTSLVQWKAQNSVHEVKLTTKLSNYQKVRTS